MSGFFVKVRNILTRVFSPEFYIRLLSMLMHALKACRWGGQALLLAASKFGQRACTAGFVGLRRNLGPKCK